MRFSPYQLAFEPLACRQRYGEFLGNRGSLRTPQQVAPTDRFWLFSILMYPIGSESKLRQQIGFWLFSILINHRVPKASCAGEWLLAFLHLNARHTQKAGVAGEGVFGFSFFECLSRPVLSLIALANGVASYSCRSMVCSLTATGRWCSLLQR